MERDVVGVEDLADVAADLGAQAVSARFPENAASMAKRRPFWRQVLISGSTRRMTAPLVGGDALVVGVHVDGVSRGAHPDPLLDQAPGHRVEAAIEGYVGVLVDTRLVPDHRHEGDRRERLEHLALLRREDLGRSALGGAVDALVGDALDPASKVSARRVHVGHPPCRPGRCA
jgi:hypothetical protein